jgi:hypothetical protein
MPCFGILRRVTVVRTDVSEERIASIIKVTIIDELGTSLPVTINRRTMQGDTIFLFIFLILPFTIYSEFCKVISK